MTIRFPSIETFLQKALAALVTSADIEAFCQEHYGRSLSLTCGVDPSVGVEDDAYPVCSLSLNDHRFANTSGALTGIDLDVATAVRDEGTVAISGVAVKAGVIRAHRLRQLVMEALMNGGLGKVEAGGGVDELVLDPLYVSYSNLTITTTK